MKPFVIQFYGKVLISLFLIPAVTFLVQFSLLASIWAFPALPSTLTFFSTLSLTFSASVSALAFSASASTQTFSASAGSGLLGLDSDLLSLCLGSGLVGLDLGFLGIAFHSSICPLYFLLLVTHSLNSCPS